MKKPVLVCGGAGYIGAIVTRFLSEHGYYPVVIDNLSTGYRIALPPDCAFYRLDLHDQDLLSTVMRTEKISAVFHFAASSLVSESVQHPHKYYYNNVEGALSLLAAMRNAGVRHIIFSSTAAVYGNPHQTPIPDDHPTSPINPYGRTKIAVENILDDYSRAYGFQSVALRYFNACGSGAGGDVGEDHRPETHLIPLIFRKAVLHGEKIQIFGHDYPTADGTPVRDYIHVTDLAEAHLRALQYLETNGPSTHFNLGNETGYSVLEVVRAVERVTGHPIGYEFVERRVGDPAVLIANSQNARTILGWRPVTSSLEEMVESAWQWHKNHPAGYSC